MGQGGLTVSLFSSIGGPFNLTSYCNVLATDTTDTNP